MIGVAEADIVAFAMVYEEGEDMSVGIDPIPAKSSKQSNSNVDSGKTTAKDRRRPQQNGRHEGTVI